MLVAGLHMESLEQAEQQLALVCELLKGVDIPLTLSMMQVSCCSAGPGYCVPCLHGSTSVGTQLRLIHSRVVPDCILLYSCKQARYTVRSSDLTHMLWAGATAGAACASRRLSQHTCSNSASGWQARACVTM